VLQGTDISGGFAQT